MRTIENIKIPCLIIIAFVTLLNHFALETSFPSFCLSRRSSKKKDRVKTILPEIVITPIPAIAFEKPKAAMSAPETRGPLIFPSLSIKR